MISSHSSEAILHNAHHQIHQSSTLVIREADKNGIDEHPSTVEHQGDDQKNIQQLSVSKIHQQ